jgi:hypothetical protein
LVDLEEDILRLEDGCRRGVKRRRERSQGQKQSWRLQYRFHVVYGAPVAGRCQKHDWREGRGRWEMVGEEEKAINVNQVSAIMTDAHGPSAVISSLLRQVIGLVTLADLAMCSHTGHMCQIRQLLSSLAISCQTDYIFLISRRWRDGVNWVGRGEKVLFTIHTYTRVYQCIPFHSLDLSSSQRL